MGADLPDRVNELEFTVHGTKSIPGLSRRVAETERCIVQIKEDQRDLPDLRKDLSESMQAILRLGEEQRDLPGLREEMAAHRKVIAEYVEEKRYTAKRNKWVYGLVVAIGGVLAWMALMLARLVPVIDALTKGH